MIEYFQTLISNITPMQIYYGVFGLSCFVLGLATKDMGQPIKWNSTQIVYALLCVFIITLLTLLIHD